MAGHLAKLSQCSYISTTENLSKQTSPYQESNHLESNLAQTRLHYTLEPKRSCHHIREIDVY